MIFYKKSIYGILTSMKILAIETSCDETAISYLQATESPTGVSFAVLGSAVHSQITVHQEYGGVFPKLAKREHQINLVPVLLQALGIDGTKITNDTLSLPPNITEILSRESELIEYFQKFVMNIPKPDIDYICVTSGPGLEPALWVGISFAKALGVIWDIPVVPVNHMEGHILSVLVPRDLQEQTFHIEYTHLQFPALALLISGGHTELVLAKNIGDYQIIGKTRDDAVGEAFDKVARILGLPYPGGPEISKLATQYTTGDLPVFPRPMLHTPDYDFSFSGLKTAVLYYAQSLEQPISEQEKITIAYEFQEAVAEVLITKTKRAIADFGVQTVIVGGGVAANTRIISGLKKMITDEFTDIQFMTPARELATDNSLMIALAGYYKIKKQPEAVYGDIRAEGNLSL